MPNQENCEGVFCLQASKDGLCQKALEIKDQAENGFKKTGTIKSWESYVARVREVVAICQYPEQLKEAIRDAKPKF